MEFHLSRLKKIPWFIISFVSQSLYKATVKLLKCITSFVAFDLKGVSKKFRRNENTLEIMSEASIPRSRTNEMSK